MEIHRLILTLTEQDLSDLARKHVAEDAGIEELEIRITPEGVRVKGVYPVFMPVSFEAVWELGVHKGRASAKLINFRTMGMPVNVLKSLIMNLVADAAKRERWLEVQGDYVLADLDALLKENGLPSQTRLTSIRCGTGSLIVEAGEEAFGE
jgi:hypothetical protein